MFASNQTRRHPPYEAPYRLSKENEVRLVADAKVGGAVAVDKVIDYLATTVRICAKLISQKWSVPERIDELEQAGRRAIPDAITRFDSERGVLFRTFASVCIRHAMIKEAMAMCVEFQVGVGFDGDDSEVYNLADPDNRDSCQQILSAIVSYHLSEAELMACKLRAQGYTFVEMPAVTSQKDRRYWSTTYDRAVAKIQELSEFVRKFDRFCCRSV